MNIKIGKMNSYEACERHLVKELTKLKDSRNLKVFCENHKINYNTASMFLNKKLKRISPNFIKNCLQALGHRVKIHRAIYYEID